jgi:hypothetical protein
VLQRSLSELTATGANPSVADKLTSPARAVCVDIAGLHDGRREPLSQSSTRHGRPGQTFTLNASAIPRRGVIAFHRSVTCRASLRSSMRRSRCLMESVRGRCGGTPRRRGCAGDFGAGQGEGFPPHVNGLSRDALGTAFLNRYRSAGFRHSLACSEARSLRCDARFRRRFEYITEVLQPQRGAPGQTDHEIQFAADRLHITA